MERLLNSLADLINLIYWLAIIFCSIFILGGLFSKRKSHTNEEEEEEDEL